VDVGELVEVQPGFYAGVDAVIDQFEGEFAGEEHAVGGVGHDTFRVAHG
jgi:hypothetical protein